MAYDFTAPATENSGPWPQATASELINRWHEKKQVPADVNNLFFYNGNRFHGQRMGPNWFHHFIRDLHLKHPTTNHNVKIVVFMAAGSGNNIRPLIGSTSQSIQEIATAYSGKYWTFRQNIWLDFDGEFSGPDGDEGHEMIAQTASSYEGNFHSISKEEVYTALSYMDEHSDRKYPNLYIFDNDAVKHMYNEVKDFGSNGNVQFNLLFGAASENERDTASHPMRFRPILDLKFSSGEESATSGSHFWDFSQPCPPNCGSGQ